MNLKEHLEHKKVNFKVNADSNANESVNVSTSAANVNCIANGMVLILVAVVSLC